MAEKGGEGRHSRELTARVTERLQKVPKKKALGKQKSPPSGEATVRHKVDVRLQGEA